jgi:nickel-dependent lactate racemase
VDHINIPFAGKRLRIKLPRGWGSVMELNPGPSQPVEDIPKALVKALEDPIGAPSLRSRGLFKKKIVIAVDDITRPTPTHLFFKDIVAYILRAGARKEDISIVTALGVHRPMTPEEIEGKLGLSSREDIRCFNHNSRDDNENLYIGKTSRGTEVILNRRLKEADLIVCVGLIEPHALLGFGGGLKMIIPGLAHEKTIAANHMRGVTPERYNYIGSLESPMRLDLEEGASLLNKDIFIINALLDRELKVTRFVCGDPIKAQREGARLSGSVNAARIEGRYDAAIVASNPMNADLRQGIKSIANIEKAVKEGGVIIAFLECRYGIGDVAVPDRPIPLSYDIFRFFLRLCGKRGILPLIDTVGRGKGTEERFLAHFSMQVARNKKIFIYAPNIPSGVGRRLGLFRQFDDIYIMLKEAERSLPASPRVAVSPYGGVTYPDII